MNIEALDELKLINENPDGFKTDTRHGTGRDVRLRYGKYETLLEIENAIICIKQEKEANLKYNRPVKHLKKQTRLLKILLQEARDKTPN